LGEQKISSITRKQENSLCVRVSAKRETHFPKWTQSRQVDDEAVAETVAGGKGVETAAGLGAAGSRRGGGGVVAGGGGGMRTRV